MSAGTSAKLQFGVVRSDFLSPDKELFVERLKKIFEVKLNIIKLHIIYSAQCSGIFSSSSMALQFGDSPSPPEVPSPSLPVEPSCSPVFKTDHRVTCVVHGI